MGAEGELARDAAVTDDLGVINGHDGAQARAEGHALPAREAQGRADGTAGDGKLEQRSVGGERSPLPQRIQPGLAAERAVGHRGVDAVQADRPAQGGVVGHRIRAPGGRNPETKVQQPVPHPGGRLMIGERDDLEVVDLAQRHIDGQLVGVGMSGPGQRPRLFLERMHVADQRALRMRQVRHIRIGRKQARRRRVRVAGIAGQQRVAMHAEHTQVAPIAGVEFLAVNHQRPGLRCRVNPDPAVGDVGEALLLVHDEILDNVQILRLRLQHQVRRRVAEVSPVVHVHVHVRAHPAPLRSVEPGVRGHHHRDIRRRPGRHLERVTLGLTRETLHHLDAHGARRNLDQVLAGGMEVARFERMLVTVELGMLCPGVRRSAEPPARIRDHDPGGRGQSMFVPHPQVHGPARAQTLSVRHLEHP